MKISLIDGLHLTATNRKQISIMIENQNFNVWWTFGRITYNVAPLENGQYEVNYWYVDSDSWGRKFKRSHRALIEVKA